MSTSNVIATAGDTAVDDQGASGYIDIGATRMQWGVHLATGNAAQTLTFGVSFGAAPYHVNCQKDNEGDNDGGNNVSVEIDTATATGIDVNPQDAETAVNDRIHYFAIGPKP